MGAPLLQEDAGDREDPLSEWAPSAELGLAFVRLAIVLRSIPNSGTNLVGHGSQCLKTSGARAADQAKWCSASSVAQKQDTRTPPGKVHLSLILLLILL